MKENTDPFGGVMKWLGILALGVVGVGVFLFSASNNFILFLGIFGHEFGGYVMAALGLTILDIAAVGWIVFGVSAARGVFQRVVSWATGAICLCLALAAAVSELIIKQTYTDRPDWIGVLAISSIVIGLIVNAIAITLTHIIDPGTMLAIKVGMKKDTVKADMADTYIDTLTESARLAKGLMKEAMPLLAKELSSELVKDAKKELLGYTPEGDGSNSRIAAPVPSPRHSAPVTAQPWQVMNAAALAQGGGNAPSSPYTRPPMPQRMPIADVDEDKPHPSAYQQDEGADEVSVRHAPLAPKASPRVTGTTYDPVTGQVLSRPVPTTAQVNRRMQE